MKKPKIGDLMFHIHHDILVEPLGHPLEDRIAYIEKNKPKAERPTRLRLMRAVKGPLPPRLERGRAAYGKAGAALDKARAAYDKAGAALDKAIVRAMPALLKLHAEQCPDCPWDGNTIFPEKNR